jgi:alanine racemase
MSPPAPSVRPTRAEINLGHIAHNVGAVRDALGSGTKLFGVVKADGYGHGAAEVGAAMVRAGADGLCVALVEEGISLRERGLRAPVLALSGLHRDGLEAALAHDVTPVVHDPAQLDELARASSRRAVPIHLKVDTGMSRLGVTLDELPAVARRLAAMPGVRVVGVMTHFANADLDDPGFCAVQLARFAEARATLAAEGIRPPLAHAANSAAALRLPATRLDLARVGVALYGVAPFPNDGGALLPVMRVRTEVLARRVIAPGHRGGLCWRVARGPADGDRHHPHRVRRRVLSSALLRGRGAGARRAGEGGRQRVDGPLHGRRDRGGPRARGAGGR